MAWYVAAKINQEKRQPSPAVSLEILRPRRCLVGNRRRRGAARTHHAVHPPGAVRGRAAEGEVARDGEEFQAPARPVQPRHGRRTGGRAAPGAMRARRPQLGLRGGDVARRTARDASARGDARGTAERRHRRRPRRRRLYCTSKSANVSSRSNLGFSRTNRGRGDGLGVSCIGVDRMVMANSNINLLNQAHSKVHPGRHPAAKKR